jgi:hypothetical protein
VTYHAGAVTGIGFQPDIIVECTGVGQVIAGSLRAIGAGGILCLTDRRGRTMSGPEPGAMPLVGELGISPVAVAVALI